MSPERSNIQALVNAIREEAREEASRILANAQTEAESIRSQAQAQATAKREAILEQARQEAEILREHATAAAHLEAQTLVLKRREQLLERVFADTRQRLASILQRPDYEQIARYLLREAVKGLGADEVVVQADEETRKVLSDAALTKLERELGVRLRTGKPLIQSTGVIVETSDGHRLYDNRLETRLARMRDVLRAPVYRILMGEMP